MERIRLYLTEMSTLKTYYLKIYLDEIVVDRIQENVKRRARRDDK